MQLMQGDCLELMNQIPDGSVDMVLCDLPYGTTDSAWDKRIPFGPLWEQYRRVTKRNAAIVLFSQMPFGAELIMSNRKAYRYEWIWEKNVATGFLNAHKMPMRSHENILVFYDRLPTYNPQFTYGEPYARKHLKRNASAVYSNGGRKDCVTVSDGKRYPVDVLRFANNPAVLFGKRTANEGLHSAQKSLPLLEYLIRTYTNEGETVLDNCMGSGSTGVACVHTGRDFIGIELDEHYFQVASERIQREIDTPRQMELDLP